MFTGIVKGVFETSHVVHKAGLVSFQVSLTPEMLENLEVGASVSIDGVCLTATRIEQGRVAFDMMQETLDRTTLGEIKDGHSVNVERSAKNGDEIGGHLLSGHVDTTARIVKIEKPENNFIITFELSSVWMKYVFSKGYIAINGASLTVVDADKGNNTFKVYLIPETLRLTTFGKKAIGDKVNIEIDKQTQVMVDSVQNYMDGLLSRLAPKIAAKYPGIDAELLTLIRS